MRNYYVVKVIGYAGDSVYHVYEKTERMAKIVARQMYENQWYMGSQSVYSVEVL